MENEEFIWERAMDNEFAHLLQLAPLISHKTELMNLV